MIQATVRGRLLRSPRLTQTARGVPHASAAINVGSAGVYHRGAVSAFGDRAAELMKFHAGDWLEIRGDVDPRPVTLDAGQTVIHLDIVAEHVERAKPGSLEAAA